MVRFVPQCVAEHLADSWELVLAVQRKNHAEQSVELGSLHALAKNKYVLSQKPLVFDFGQIDVSSQISRDARHKLVLFDDRLHVLKHRLALVRVDSQGADHVEERIRMNILLMRMPAKDEFQFRRCDQFAHHMLDIVPNNPLSSREVADAHPDNPPFHIRNHLTVLPLLNVLAHSNILRLPMIRLHFAV